MSEIELFFLMIAIYIMPIIFLSPYCKSRLIHFIPIFNLIWMLLLLIQEVEIWLSNQNNDDDNLKGSL